MSTDSSSRTRSLHHLGVVCGLAAGAWLGVAEVPIKLAGDLSPYISCLGMVAGVFVARWTVPMLLKGTGYIWSDLREKPHLMVWAILAGMLWAVANTLTVFAIQIIGLSIAFPIWNSNCLVGLFWGWLLFNELRNAGARQWLKVLGGGVAIVAGTCLLTLAKVLLTNETAQQHDPASQRLAILAVLAALGAGLLWGTMYIPYRKAYISGMNPLSFVTVFTFGELGTVATLALIFGGGASGLQTQLVAAQGVMFWLFLGGFCWVLGDLFQQYAAKYIGIGRGIPLSNTNQLWGLAWGALVFGELSKLTDMGSALVVAGSLVAILGVASISQAEAAESEQASWKEAMDRECQRYGMNPARVAASMEGHDALAGETPRRQWWEFLVVLVALGVFAWLGSYAKIPPITMDYTRALLLSGVTLAILVGGGVLLWKRTRFS